MEQIHAQNQNLLRHVSGVEEQRKHLVHQLGDMRDKWAIGAQNNMRLQGELAAVRRALEARLLFFTAY
jgi:regulator of replication initiation timing